MRNLKKVLALVLVFAMTFTMVSFAALEDVAGSDYENQIRTNVALGIIKGKDNGDFDPTGNVTRAEMAKMIYVLLKGKDDGAVIYKGASDLKDVKGHWAEGYINYCYSLDIIAGRGNGLFDPNANVTAAEASKMLLVALGWDANKEGLVGASWAIKAIALGEKEDILDEFPEDGDIMAPLSRELAANLIYNALFANTVTYVEWGRDAGMIATGKSLAEDVFELLKADAILKETEIVGIGEASPEGTTTYKVLDDPTTDADDDSVEIVVADTSADYNDLGRIFTVYYQEDVSKADKNLGADATLFTAIYSEDNKVIASTGGNFNNEPGDKKYFNLSTGISNYGIQDSSNAWNMLGNGWNTDKAFMNGTAIGQIDFVCRKDSTDPSKGTKTLSMELPFYKTSLPLYLLTDADKSAPKKLTGASSQFKSYVGYEYTSDKYNYVIGFVPTFVKVTDVKTDKVSFKDGFKNESVTVDVDDIFYKGIDGVAKDDYVLLYPMNGVANTIVGANKYVVAECPTVTGKVVGFDSDKKPILASGAVLTPQGNNKVAGDGTTTLLSEEYAKRKTGIPGTMYELYNSDKALPENLKPSPKVEYKTTEQLQEVVAPYIGKEVTFYTDGKYVVFAESAEEGVAKTYLVAMKDTIAADKANLTATKWNLYVTALFADGTEKDIQVTKVDGTEVSKQTSKANAELLLTDDEAYTYVEVDGKYELKAIAGPSAFGASPVASYLKDSGMFKSGSNYYYIMDKTAVFIKKGSEDVIAVDAADIRKDFVTGVSGSITTTVEYKAKTANGKVADLEYVYITTNDTLTTGISDYKFAAAMSDGQYLYDSTEKKWYGTIKLFVDGEVGTYVSETELDSSPGSFVSARSFMAVAFAGAKLRVKDDGSAIDFIFFEDTVKVKDGALEKAGDNRPKLNSALGQLSGDDDFNKLYVVTTSATELKGSLLFTKWDEKAGFDREFIIDKDTDIYGFNSVAGTAAANEIVTRSDYYRNVTIVYSHDDNGTVDGADDVLTARYILVDAGLAEAKNCMR